jgi:membrane protein YdbS with pleckstrin-like domain
MNADPVPEAILALEKPHPSLWKYYIIRALLTGPGAIGALPYLYFRYHTLRYRFDAEGIHMKVGILFRREVNLTYARIQDIHLRSGIIQRWLGLANLQVQTASGSGGPELVIEGFKEFEAIRDFLYTRMRGYQMTGAAHHPTPGPTSTISASPGAEAETIALLLSIRDELRQAREGMESRMGGAPSSTPADKHA